MVTKNRSDESHQEKHEFAFFVSLLSTIIESVKPYQEMVITDELLCHRLKTVVRLQAGDYCKFFDRSLFAECEIKEFIGKKQIRCVVRAKKKTESIEPTITFLLPLLKKEDYEQAIYALAEMGVTTIQLVFTHKSRSFWGGVKDVERAQRILISAAEQSKNFLYPEIKEPVKLNEAIVMHGSKKVFFDPCGDSALSVFSSLQPLSTEHIMLCVGPEGDLTHDEKAQLRENNFTFCALTPTVLRAVQAVTVSVGLARSLWR